MYSIVIVCTALNCIFTPAPQVRLNYLTHAECDRALLIVAKSREWRLIYGAWKMNCIKRG